MNLKPSYFKKNLALSRRDTEFIKYTRKACKKIFNEKNKLILFVGPCSIHNPQSALEYAKKLSKLSHMVSDKIVIVMRTFIEKSRTSVGWTGLVNDPMLNNSQSLLDGIYQSRSLMLEITKLCIPICMEIIDPMLIPFFDDLLSWGFIGARSVHSQLHRKLASGFDFPIGFKNALDGDVNPCIDALKVANQGTSQIQINKEGILELSETKGNPFCHITLRGGYKSTNYRIEEINTSLKKQEKANLNRPIVIDCAHGNSHKSSEGQITALNYLIKHLGQVQAPILGIMIESFLESGSQKKPIDPKISITDPCLDFQTTSLLIQKLHQALSLSPNDYECIHPTPDHSLL